MKLARLLLARLILWLVRRFPDLAELGRLLVCLSRIKLGRLAFRASWAFAAVAERLLEPELRRIDQ